MDKFSVTGISGNGGGTSIFPQNSHLKLYSRGLILHQLKSSIYSLAIKSNFIPAQVELLLAICWIPSLESQRQTIFMF